MRNAARLALGLLTALVCAALGSGCGVDHSTRSSDRSKPPAVDGANEPSGLAVSDRGGDIRELPGANYRVEPTDAKLGLDDPGLQLVVRSADESRPAHLSGASWFVEPEGVVALDAGGYVRPLKSGVATATARLEGEQASTTIEVVAGAERPWDFAADIVPLFTRFGCNTGGCHGRADGQNGFHLSLFGYDPTSDFHALARESGGRRIDRVRPSTSLLLLKATGQVAHGGGQRLVPGSPAHQTLLAWIASGAPEQRGATHGSLTEVSVEPSHVMLSEPGSIQLRVLARYQDGHTRDVTRLAQLRTNDDRISAVDERGMARLLRRGESDQIVRFASRVVSARIAAPVNPDLSFPFDTLKRANFIDDHVYKRLALLKVPPSPAAPDALFLRRLSLDLTGQLPEPDEIKAFVASMAPDKRAHKVDELMARAEFVQSWALKFGDLLQISLARFGNGAGAYENWLLRALRENRRWDAMVRELLTALGDPTDFREGGPVNYAIEGGDALTRAELTARRFLGIRLHCAQCHDHPFDVWTQDDYYGLAACFAKIDRGGGGDPTMMAMRARVGINPKGAVNHKRTNQPASARLLDGTLVQVAENKDPRGPLADWITRPDNRFFARATVNLLWAQFFGRGIVDPPDDMSSSNPPVHPELLDALARHFVEHDYDLRELIRTITTSEIYGLSSSTVPGNEQDTRLFSHQTPRPLTAHQMADALAQATSVPNVFPNRVSRSRTRAIEIFDPATPSVILDTFGRCSRNEICSAVASPQLSLRQALLLIGGDVIDGKVAHLNGYLANLLELNPLPDEIVEFLYMRTLCRPPTNEERSHWSAELVAATSLREAAEDLFWALLNSREFAFNH